MIIRATQLWKITMIRLFIEEKLFIYHINRKNQNQIISGVSIILLFSDFRHYVTYIILIKQSNSESITKNKITFSVHVVCLVINTCR